MKTTSPYASWSVYTQFVHPYDPSTDGLRQIVDVHRIVFIIPSNPRILPFLRPSV